MNRRSSGAAFWVYVVELDPEAFDFAGPGVVYVGETSSSPEERLAKHLAGGITSSRIVTQYGLRLRKDLAPPKPFGTREDAQLVEYLTAVVLRAKGYVVYGGQGRPFMADR